MKKRVILVYDCPFDKCDKLWVYHGLLEHGYEVIDVGAMQLDPEDDFPDYVREAVGRWRELPVFLV